MLCCKDEILQPQTEGRLSMSYICTKAYCQTLIIDPCERDGIVRNLGINTTSFFLPFTAEFHEKECVTFSFDETGVWLKPESQNPQLRIIPMQMRSFSCGIQTSDICSPFKLKNKVTIV